MVTGVIRNGSTRNHGQTTWEVPQLLGRQLHLVPTYTMPSNNMYLNISDTIMHHITVHVSYTQYIHHNIHSCSNSPYFIIYTCTHHNNTVHTSYCWSVLVSADDGMVLNGYMVPSPVVNIIVLLVSFSISWWVTIK